MRCRSYTLLAVILTAACARAQVASSPPSELAITGATLIDGTGAPPLSNAVVLIKGDRIMAVGKHPKIRIPRDARIIDARGRWIIPGLVDAHVHFFQSGGLYTRPDVIDLRKRRPYEQELKWIHDHLLTTFSRYLCSGITAAVDVGGPNWNFTVRELAAHTANAPRVAVAGPLVSTYAPEKLQTADPPIIKVSTPDEARALVRRDIAHNPDLLKIWFIRTPNAKLEDLIQVYQAAIEESHAHSVRVAVHATELETAKAAARLGADVLVHSVADQVVDDEFIQAVKEHGIIYTSSIVVYEGYGKVLTQDVALTDVDRTCGDPEVIASWGDLAKLTPRERPPTPAWSKGTTIAIRVMQENLRRMQNAGAIVAAGTDAGNIGTLHGSSLHREFELMQEAGLNPMEILVAATRNAARVFSLKAEIGTVEPGKLADLVLLDADPLADIRNARKIRTVIKGGQVLDRPLLLQPY